MLCTYCARKVDGVSRNAIDSVGQTSMQKIAFSTKKKKTGHVPVPATMLKQHAEANATANTVTPHQWGGGVWGFYIQLFDSI